MTTHRKADPIDAALLKALIADPDATNIAVAESTGLARNTVRSRLARYAEEAALRSFERRIDPAFLGYPLSAYVVTKVTQRKLASVGKALGEIPEVLEVQGLSGVSDLLVHVVARDADDLYRIAGRILGTDGVKRTNTGLVMRELVTYRIAQLLTADDAKN
ncbi:Lrp/AsnC family transcriptional regulator [Pseudarthrobacter oxydans]|jgi:DNA-binding Lrp family transcriptional regulator|uniref:AsnC family transcriptional regulator n=1 Tax=Arthrobacter liuii TaxID=1476996 RepID=A0ABQ2AYY2_9MICC|nr:MULTISPECIES: Lrp/AsnC family transcriptional regulator [Micrococcaceae]MDV2982608.1 Lrp/AsnC family transcriptional regulator [Actinomycetes bacterium ARC8]NSX38921.1 Lrp/AsnC family transcriptional regulator [Pseudarthrobacter oxydans]BFE43457.1 Lrp/AsnC family transcriptional regulator [Pseudarthrobacter oxydans]GGH99958.1 AsnC family transcriptional regulator [Arthrobacter liuii]GKV71233.1 AsnC family transcriptional regulator [Pseudarthrobacter sp. NCCP-2145]